MEPISQGLLGLILYLSHWLSPDMGKAELTAAAVQLSHSQTVVARCRMDLAWNNRLEQLVDAGVPLRFRFICYIDNTDSVFFFRTLSCDIVNYTYTITDSNSLSTKNSGEYQMVLLALKNFCTWDMPLPSSAQSCRIEAQILPSRAARLDRMVDMSRIWGQRKVSCELNLNKRNRK
jgi:hypothetical protein